jgi:hypothetical protein
VRADFVLGLGNMRKNDESREASMSDAPKDLEEVQRRLNEIQSRKRGETRWTISRHTAEMAMEAISEPRGAAAKSTGKSRRRKRRKRML